MILNENQIKMYKDCKFLNESPKIYQKYRDVNLEVDMDIESYGKYNKYFNEFFRTIDKNYDKVMKDCYEKEYKAMGLEKCKNLKQFLSIIKLEDYGRISVFKKHDILFVELHYLINDYRKIPMMITFNYRINDKKIKWEFNGSD